MTILVTGASGFIGSFIIEEGLRRGHEMWAGMRASSSRKYLQDHRIRFAELNLSDLTVLCSQLRALKQLMGGRTWDYVVHAAGATKCVKSDDFYRTNTLGTQNLVKALQAEDMVPKRFVFVSSLSVFGAIRETPVQHPTHGNTAHTANWVYEPIRLTDTPQPNTEYGKSKLKAEEFLMALSAEASAMGATQFPWVILRPTGVYGPRERDYFMMAKSIKQHTDFAVGYRPQEITFVYVRDLVDAVFLAIKAGGVEGKAYFLSDGEVYHSRRFSDLLQAELGNPWVLHIKAPIWLTRLICAVSGTVCGWLGKTSTLNRDKFHILSQRNWQCDIEPARRDLGYAPQWQLERGVKEAVQWYKENKWL